MLRACMDYYEPYDYTTSFFLNDINKEAAFNAFNFYDNIPYLQNWYVYNDCREEDTFSDPNIDEWYAYANNEAGKEDIKAFVYKYPLSDLADYYLRLRKAPAAPISEKIRKNKFAQWLGRKRNTDALAYLFYAKKCEPLVLEEYLDANNKWATSTHDTGKLDALIKTGLAQRAKTKSQFLKWRYTFQLLRLAMYNGRERQTLKLYDELVSDKKYSGIMYGRCLGLKAGALFRAGDSTQMGQAAYLYSRVFDMSDELKPESHISFEWCGNDHIKEAFRYCKNDHEKAVIYIMQALYQFLEQEKSGIAQMKNAYRLDPNVRGLEVIMTRELNKLEDRYYPRQLLKKDKLKEGVFCTYEGKTYVYGGHIRDKDYSSYIAQLKTFTRQVIDDNKNSHKAYWHIAAGYLDMMSLDAAACTLELALAEKYKMNDREKDVYHILEALCIASHDEVITAKTEEELLPSLKYISQKAETSARFNQVNHDIMIIILAGAYLHQKDTVRAVYCLSKSQQNFCKNKNKDERDPNVDSRFIDAPGQLLEQMSIDGVRAFIQKKNKTPFEQWLLDSSYYTMDVLNELDGTKYIRLHDFGKAKETLAKVSKQILNKRVIADPFAETVTDTLKVDKTKRRMNKYVFAKTMAGLQYKISTNHADAATMYKYATGLYNISFYGKGWDMSQYYHQASDRNAYFATPERKKLPLANRDYYDVSEPEKYFIMACKTAKSKELRAKCLYMAAECWQKRCPFSKKADELYYVYNKKNPYYINALQNPYFQQLSRKCKNTQFFAEALSTCSYLRDYVKRGK